MIHPVRPHAAPPVPSSAAPSPPREPSPSLLAHLQSAPVFQRLLAFVVRKNVPHRHAEDLVQQSLIEAWNARHTWGPTTDDLDRLLSTIARRNVLDHQKGWFRSRLAPSNDAAKARRAQADAEGSDSSGSDAPPEDDAPSLTTPAAPHEARDRLEKMNAFVEATPRYRRAAGWLARNLAGESLEEIARSEGATENAVTVAVSKLRSALRQAAKDGLILLVVTAFAGLLLSHMRHVRPDGPSQGAPDSAQVTRDVPARRGQADGLRERAGAACDAGRWEACARDLDAASRLDPAGDLQPRARELRARILDATGSRAAPTP